MYPAMVNSPITSLVSGIDEVATAIEVTDASKLPAGPNIAVIGRGEGAETILYTAKSGNILIGVTRGFQGTARAWPYATEVARYFTAYDYDALRQNFIAHKADNMSDDVHGLGYKGVFASIKATQSIPNNTPTPIAFNDIYREAGHQFWHSSEPTRLAIPSGVSKIRLIAQVGWSDISTGIREIGIFKNGSITNTPRATKSSDVFEGNLLGSAVRTIMQININEIDVSQGDYFELYVAQNSGSATNASPTGRVTYLALEVIQ